MISALTALAGLPWLLQLMRALRPSFEAIAAGRSGPNPFSVLTDPAVTPVIQRYQFAGLLAGMVYTVVMIHLWGATLGKLAVGVRVRSWDQPGRPGWTQSLVRWLTRDAVGYLPVFGSLYWLLDSVWLLWDPRRQCLHDKLPRTVVVRGRSQQPGPSPHPTGA